MLSRERVPRMPTKRGRTSQTTKAQVIEQNVEIGKCEGKSKYGNKKVVVDGIAFHSRKEANRYCELKLLERAKEINDLQLQVKFEINPKFVTEEGVTFNKRVYVADFVYYDRKLKGKVIEDTKGYSTQEFKRKWRQMQERYRKEYLFLIT
jgi:hypothetical protein